MHRRRIFWFEIPSVLLLLAALFVSPPSARAQAPAPWSGIAANEASRTPGWAQGSNDMSSHALSADGRYVVFHSDIATLVPNDNNGWNDIFLRDRVTGVLTRISVASDGTEGNNYSYSPVISADGRFIAFYSCATNLDPTDTNDACDVFVHDRIEHTTTRESLGPNGEQAASVTNQFRLSGDGRYLVFNASFDAQNWERHVYLRDRDPDANGVLDEPGLSTTTQISESTVGIYQLISAEDVAISNDGRYVAYVSFTTDTSTSTDIGQRVYVHDRLVASTFRVDIPAPGIAERNDAFASGLDFSNAGQLAYATSAPLVDTDTDEQADVYVIDLITGGNLLVEVTLVDPQMQTFVWAPAISADGRYVAVMTGELTPGFSWNYNVYGVDRQTQQSSLVSVLPTVVGFPIGTAVNDASAPSITADGLGIAFAADATMLINGWGTRGVFVATDVAIAPALIEVPEIGGTYTVEVTAPATTGWSLEHGPDATVNPSSGNGSATVEVTIAPNTSADDLRNFITIGSEQVVFHQTLPPQSYYSMPYHATTSGGTDVDIFGAGFVEGMTVEFGGTPATNVTFIDSGHIVATTPAHFGGWVSIKVTKPSGTSAELFLMFFFDDTTPPIVTSVVTGTLGANGWYTSDVTVNWTVEDNESTIGTDPCLTFAQTTDVASLIATCYAESYGGSTLGEVQIKRDTVAPTVAVAVPDDVTTYLYGSSVPLIYQCDDDTSGIAACTPNQTSATYLDTTSFVGGKDFIVTATDAAGHSISSQRINYSVKYSSTLELVPATATYGESVTLGATLYQPSTAGLGNATIAFFLDDVPVGTAITSYYGYAATPVSLAGLSVGVHVVRAEFAGNGSFVPASATSSLVISKATPAITWEYPALMINPTPLGATQLNASTTIAGTFTYSPAAGTVLPIGTHLLTVTFTPSEPQNYNTATKWVVVQVKGQPVITWIATGMSYPATLPSSALSASANVPGNFVYTPPAGTALDVGTHTLSVTFTPFDTARYLTATKTISFQVTRGIPTITWPASNAIPYGTPLSTTQLNASSNVPGTFVYNQAIGTVLPAGTHQLSVVFTPDDAAHWQPLTRFKSQVVTHLTPTVNWTPPTTMSWGPLGPAQQNATSPLPGTFGYWPEPGTVMEVGQREIRVVFNPDDPNYSSPTIYRSITVTKLVPVVSWNNPAPIVYGTQLNATQLNATASVAGTFAYSPSNGTLLAVGTRTLNVTFTPTDSAHYASATGQVTIDVSARTPIITWNTPASIVYGTALGSTQYNATVDASGGQFEFTPPIGTILNAGAGQTLTATYVPGSANYVTVSASVTIDVAKAQAPITWANPTTITYGTSLSATQLNASTSVAGSLEYSPPDGTVIGGGLRTLTATFTPTDQANYAITTKSVTLTVNKATPVITWPAQTAITYGTALSATQLSATANVPGTFSYNPDAGTVLNAGWYQLYVMFTPDAAENYSNVAKNAQLSVYQAVPVITWPAPATIPYGTALSATQLNATADVPGTFSYTPASGTVLEPGTHHLSVWITPTDTLNYGMGVGGASITVGKLTPQVTWSNPAAITYGTALSATQLNATANVPGTFSYSPAAGTILAAGNTTLWVTFMPTDSAHYTFTQASVTLQVNKATPILNWGAPAAINYGTALSGAQLNATANVPGTFAYSPAAGAMLGAGTQPLSVTFTPTDTANYAIASANVNLVVNKATSVVTWANPAGITYGTALSATQLNATANVPGTFAYSPAAASVLGAGTQSLSVTFTPTDAANYTTASKNVSITIAKKALTVRTDNATKVYGEALPAFTVSGTGLVNGDTVASLSGTAVFATSATATSAPGSYSVTPSGLTSANYTMTFTAGTLTVAKASTSVAFTTSPSPSINNQTVQLRAVVSAVAPGAGTPTGTVQFKEGSTLLGTATLVNGVATMNKSFKRGSHSLTATYVASTNFNSSVGSKTHQVN